MFTFKILLITTLVASIVSGGSFGGQDKDKDGKGKGGHHEKMKKCFKQVKELEDKCCPLPKPDENAETDPDCAHHLEGIEAKEKKEQHKAKGCYMECVFKKNGVISEDGEIVKEKFKESTEQYLEKAEALEFKDATFNAIDTCIADFDAKKEKWAKWGEKKDKPENGTEGEKKCGKKAGHLMGCVMGTVVRNCPAEKWKGGEECETLKKNLETSEDCKKKD